RDVANIVMDVNGVEIIHFNALGGADSINVGDLSHTDVKQVQVDLGAAGGTTPDGAVDSVTVNGTQGGDSVTISGSGGSVTVAGLAAQVSISHADTFDQLVIQTLGGADTIDASTLAAGVMQLTIDAGAGNDTITGSAGNDRILAGDGNDVVIGGRGDD